MFPVILKTVLKKMPADALPFVRFCVIGGVNTVIHAAVLFALVEGSLALALRRPWGLAGLNWLAENLTADWLILGAIAVGLAEWANVVAFLFANAFSYFANSRWSFDAKLRFSRYARFLPTSLVGFFCAYGIMHFVTVQGWHYLVAVLIQVCVTPLINFTLLRLFVFPRKKDAAAIPESSPANTGRDEG